MGRFFLTVLMGLGIVGAIAWWFDLWPTSDRSTATTKRKSDQPKGPKPPAPASVDWGEPLYPAWKVAEPQPEREAPRTERRTIIGGQLAVVDKVDAAAEVDGALLYVGEDLPDGAVAAAGVAPFMADPYRFATIHLGGDRDLVKFYRRLQENMPVRPDQIVGMLNPARAIHELAIRRAKTEAAVADWEATVATLKEAETRKEIAWGLLNQRPPAITREEYRSAELTVQKYLKESV